MEPGHYTIHNEPTTAKTTEESPYKLAARWDKRMKMIRISVTGDSFRGFLVQGRTEKSGPAIGNFINITENPDVAYQNCDLYPEVR